MEKRRVLIIDDSSEDRATLRRYLSKDPHITYEFIEKDSVTSGLEWIRNSQVECVVLDYFLPDGTGLDVLRGMKDENGNVPFPTVILTGTIKADASAEFLAAGADDYLLKDETTADAVRLAVSNAIYRRQAQQKMAAQQTELVRLCMELEKRVQEAEAAKLEAERASSAKDDFLAALSHELRTPLTPVLSLVSSTLNEGRLGPDLREAFTIIQRNIQLEARLIDDLLDLTQVASGRLPLERKPVDFHACILGATEICAGAFQDRNIELKTQLDASQEMVTGDAPRLHQVLWNLLKNAAKFTPPGGKVTAATFNEGSQIILEVRDTGIGIAETRLTSVFGGFGQRNPRLTSTGLGLGLTIAKAIVEAHGGSITVASDGIDQGSTFRVALPTANSASVVSVESLSGEVPERGHTVLVVEDHEDTRRVLSRALRRRGFGVALADGVQSAVDQYRMNHPDVVICDLGLPDGTGWDVLEKLRTLGPVKAIAVSGYGMEHDVQRSQDVGFFAHITKPVDFPKLEDALAKALRG